MRSPISTLGKLALGISLMIVGACSTSDDGGTPEARNAVAVDLPPVAPTALSVPEVGVPAGQVAVVSLPDAAATRQRLGHSLFGRIWSHAELTDWRRAIGELLRQRTEEAVANGRPEPSAEALIGSVEQMAIQWPPRGQPAFQIDTGDPALAGLLIDSMTGSATWPADEALPAGASDGRVRGDTWYLRYDDRVVALPAAAADREPRLLPALDGWDVHAWVDLQAAPRLFGFGSRRRPVPALYPSVDAWLRLRPGGAEEVYRFAGAPKLARPIDQALLRRIGADVDLLVAVGLDGKRFWNDLVAPLQMATKTDPQLLDRLFTELVGDGLQASLMDLVAEVQGTMVLALREDGPMSVPKGLLALPRSPRLDQLVEVGFRLLGFLPPEPGSSIDIPVDQLLDWHGPVISATVRADDSHWLLSTDPAMLARWLQQDATDDAWSDSATGRAALTAAGEQAQLVLAYRAPALLRRVATLLQQAAPEEDRAVDWSSIVADVASAAEPGWIVAYGQEQQQWLRCGGPLGGPATMLLWATAVELAEDLSRDARRFFRQEAQSVEEQQVAQVQARLRAECFAALVQFQAGAYNDLDGDNRGEYGFLPQLSGQAACFGRADGEGMEAGQLSFLTVEMSGRQAYHGYRLALFMSDGKGGAITWDGDVQHMEARFDNDRAISDAEKYFIIYAWPTAGISDERPVLCLTQDGHVHASNDATISLPPAWHVATEAGAEADSFTHVRILRWPRLIAPERQRSSTIRHPLQQLEAQIGRALQQVARTGSLPD